MPRPSEVPGSLLFYSFSGSPTPSPRATSDHVLGKTSNYIAPKPPPKPTSNSKISKSEKLTQKGPHPSTKNDKTSIYQPPGLRSASEAPTSHNTVDHHQGNYKVPNITYNSESSTADETPESTNVLKAAHTAKDPTSTLGQKPKKKIMHYTQEQVEWITNYVSTELTDRTIISWNRAAIAFKATFGDDRPGHLLRVKFRRLGEKAQIRSYTNTNDPGAKEMEVDGESGINEVVLKKLAHTRGNTGFMEAIPTSAQEHWLKENIHKFQDVAFKIDWFIVADLFTDIFEVKVSAQLMENIWGQVVYNNDSLFPRVIEG